MKNQKLFVIKKYVLAKSASDAIKKDKHTKVDDCWVDDEWKKGQANQLASAIGFIVHTDA